MRRRGLAFKLSGPWCSRVAPAASCPRVPWHPTPLPRRVTAHTCAACWWPRRYGGLWRTRVLGVTFTGRPKPFGPSADPGGLLGGSTMRLARVLIGDPGGAQAELALPYDARWACWASRGGGHRAGRSQATGWVARAPPPVRQGLRRPSPGPACPGCSTDRMQLNNAPPPLRRLPGAQVRADTAWRAGRAGGAQLRTLLPAVQGGPSCRRQACPDGRVQPRWLAAKACWHRAAKHVHLRCVSAVPTSPLPPSCCGQGCEEHAPARRVHPASQSRVRSLKALHPPTPRHPPPPPHPTPTHPYAPPTHTPPPHPHPHPHPCRR